MQSIGSTKATSRTTRYALSCLGSKFVVVTGVRAEVLPSGGIKSSFPLQEQSAVVPCPETPSGVHPFP